MTATPPTRIELSGLNVASCLGVTVKGRGMASPIGPLCRKLIDERLCKPFADVEIWRGGTKCFMRAPLIHWASLHCSEGADTSATVSVYKPRPEFAASEVQ
ncbi:hypothetical protein [Dinoroseobacter sp. S124A]|uniref:hypothetical protein n=1 Tax=Dinoroseobacter sp. S124A TaxID=3415128 RepID=UPI003C7C3DBD